MVPVTMAQPSTSGSAVQKPRPKIKTSTHPPVAKMINEALKSLDNHKGSSVQAIKKYIEEKYIVDPVKVKPIMKKYLKKAVESRILIQTKGVGATGSFKLPSKKSKGTSVKPKHVTGSEEIVKKTPSKETVKETVQKKRSNTETSKKVQKKTSKSAIKKSPKTGARQSVEKKASRASIAGTSDGRRSPEIKNRPSRSSIA